MKEFSFKSLQMYGKEKTNKDPIYISIHSLFKVLFVEAPFWYQLQSQVFSLILCSKIGTHILGSFFCSTLQDISISIMLDGKCRVTAFFTSLQRFSVRSMLCLGRSWTFTLSGSHSFSHLGFMLRVLFEDETFTRGPDGS